MSLPSGNQTGSFGPGEMGMCLKSEPSARTNAMPLPAAVVETTARKFVVSGAHTGCLSLLGKLCGSTWCGFDPSAFMIHSRVVPERFEENASRVPSGDHAGLWSRYTPGSG